MKYVWYYTHARLISTFIRIFIIHNNNYIAMQGSCQYHLVIFLKFSSIIFAIVDRPIRWFSNVNM